MNKTVPISLVSKTSQWPLAALHFPNKPPINIIILLSIGHYDLEVKPIWHID